MRQEPITMNELINEIELLVTRRRVHRVNTALIVGVAGPPSSGKTKTAELLMRRLEANGIVTSLIPMDGYRYSGAVLEELKLSHAKGSLETINVSDYTHDLQRAYEGHENFFVPVYSRAIGEPIANALEVASNSDVVITEGDYILLKEHPGWASVHKILDVSVYIETPKEVRLERLLARRSSVWGEERARDWIETVDEPNATRVEAFIRFADFFMKNDVEENEKLMDRVRGTLQRLLRRTDTKPVVTTKNGEQL